MCYCRPEIRTPYCSQCPQKMHDEITRLRKIEAAALKVRNNPSWEDDSFYDSLDELWDALRGEEVK